MHPLRRAHFVAVDAALDQPQFVLCIVGTKAVRQPGSAVRLN
jgi:hypothetical protein